MRHRVASKDVFESEEGNLQVFLELRALVRFIHYKNWDYVDGELDYARLSNFIQARIPKANQWVIERYQNVKGDIVPNLTQVLLWQSRILNVPESHRSDDASLVSAIFRTEPPAQEKDDDLDWQSFLVECNAARPILILSLIHI